MDQEGILEHKQFNEPTVKSSILPAHVNKKPTMRNETIEARLTDVCNSGMKLSRIAIESNVSKDHLEAWVNGKKSEETTRALSSWFTGIDEELAERNGDFFMSPSAEKFLNAFERAREPKGKDGSRGIAMIYGASGTGKSITAKWAAGMDENVVYVQADGDRNTWTGLLKGVVESMDYYGRVDIGKKLREFILRKIRPGGLLIFDHAQLIRLSVMEQLLIFPDEYGVALAFIGNTKGYKDFTNAKLAHISSRVRGSIVFVEIPGEDDIDAFLEARSVGGRKEREFCLMIGRQDGGLRYLDNTIFEARKIACALGAEKLDLKLLKLGAANAGCWGS